MPSAKLLTLVHAHGKSGKTKKHKIIKETFPWKTSLFLVTLLTSLSS